MIAPAWRAEVDDGIGAKGGTHIALPARCSYCRMVGEWVGRGIGRAERLDIETLEQRSRAKCGRDQAFRDLIVDALRRGARQFLIDTENIAQFVPQPYARRRAAKKIEVLGEELPDVTLVTFHRPSVAGRNAQPLKRYALRIEHAKDIVIRDDEQIDRSAKGVIQFGKNARVYVPMRAEQRAIGNLRIELHGDDAHGRFRIEITCILHHFLSQFPWFYF